jgi:hypothetical protein
VGSVDTVIAKYTGHDITEEHLIAAASDTDPRRHELANAIECAAWLLQTTEQELASLSSQIAGILTKVDHNLTAAPGQQVYSLNPLGELQAGAPRFDVLIAVRDERIRHLRNLTRLWTSHQSDQR